MSNNARNEQFAGFAFRLLQELLNQGAYVAISEWATSGDRFKSEQLIARRAYDLVYHALDIAETEHRYGSPTIEEVLRNVPDMAELPEEQKQ